MAGRRRRTLEVRPNGFVDPDGRRTAAIASAYFAAVNARAARQSTWRVACLVALAATLLRLATGGLTTIDLVFLMVLLAAAVVAVAVLEQRARTRFSAAASGPPPR